MFAGFLKRLKYASRFFIYVSFYNVVTESASGNMADGVALMESDGETS
jgi:hypothetical protein